MHEALVAFSFARLKAGNNIAAKIAIIAMTTNSSIKVKAWGFEREYPLGNRDFEDSKSDGGNRHDLNIKCIIWLYLDIRLFGVSFRQLFATENHQAQTCSQPVKKQ